MPGFSPIELGIPPRLLADRTQATRARSVAGTTLEQQLDQLEGFLARLGTGAGA